MGLKKITRLRAWRAALFTENIHVCYFTIFYLLLITNFSVDIFGVLLLLVSLVLYFSYGFLANDYFDMPYDKLVGKRKIIFDIPINHIKIILTLLVGVNALLTVIVNNISFFFIYLLAYILATFYSAPPFRFKDRGATGFLIDAAIEKPFPVLLIFSFFNYYNIEILFFFMMAFLIQLFRVLKQQIDDYENDLRSKTNTFVVSIGKEMAKTILKRYFYPLNIISILSFYAIVAFKMQIYTLLVGYFIFLILGAILLGAFERINKDIYDKLHRGLNEGLYVKDIPMSITYVNWSFYGVFIFILALKTLFESTAYTAISFFYIISQYNLWKSLISYKVRRFI